MDYVDCTNNCFGQHILHSVIHANWIHLIVNTYSLYNLSNLEKVYGSANYAMLIMLLFIGSSYVQYLLKVLNKIYPSLFPKTKCAVGFSAVIMGLIGFESISKKAGGIDYSQLMLLLVIPLVNPQISMSGHLSGLIVGAFLAYMSNVFMS